MGFEILDHTGDLAVRLRAPDLAGLVVAGTRALRSLIYEDQPEPERPDRHTEVGADGLDREDLLVRTLSEVLFVLQHQELDPVDVTVTVVGDREASVSLAGGSGAGRRRLEIKAVTYHQVHVVESEGGLEATLVLDV